MIHLADTAGRGWTLDSQEDEKAWGAQLHDGITLSYIGRGPGIFIIKYTNNLHNTPFATKH
jgi:hypothetical protein